MKSPIEKTFFQRSLLVFVLIVLFVIVILSVSIFVYVTGRPIKKEGIQNEKMNVLFIVVDDLRPTLSCYNDKTAITPNIDQLAAKSVLFTNAYTQQSLCGPSRVSFLTGRRPDSLHVYDNTGYYWRDAIGDFTSLPDHFKKHGYETISIGKIFDPGATSNHTDDYPYSWSAEPYHPPSLDKDEVCLTDKGERNNLFCPVKKNKHNLPDMQVTEFAVKYLRNRASGMMRDISFFMGVGFYRPHIPFKFPAEYLDLYPIEAIELAANSTKPERIPSVSWNPWFDIRSKDDVVEELNVTGLLDPIPEYFQKRIKRGYYASVSYIDNQVGKILEALEQSGYAPYTAIVFVSDHGWSLGEHGEWDKFSNFEVALQVPFIVYVPDLTESVEERTPFHYTPVTEVKRRYYNPPKARFVADEFVELVDLFPTLAETVNIAVPPLCPLNSRSVLYCSEGTSFFPVIFNNVFPSMDFSWKTAVYSQYPRPSFIPRNNSDQPILKNIKIMGYTIRDTYFRYTRWVKFNNWFHEPHWGTFEGHELYDKIKDPLEINNLVGNSTYANIVIKYLIRLKNGWRKELPYAVYSSSLRVNRSLHENKRKNIH